MHLISIDDLETQTILGLFESAQQIQQSPRQWKRGLEGIVITNLFYEPSTRTSSSFYAATVKQGGHCIPINDVTYSSVSKGESIKDTVRTLGAYSDLIVLRSSYKGAAEWAAEVSPVPIINAGDGIGEHPTQTLIDAYTIWLNHGYMFQGLKVGLMGDLRNSRTVKSLYKFLMRFNTDIYEIAPKLRRIYRLENSPMSVDHLKTVASKLDVLYMTRLQEERGTHTDEQYMLTKKDVALLKKDMSVLHPFPRVNEIPEWFDEDPRAKYFEQIQNGLYVRMALLQYMLGR